MTGPRLIPAALLITLVESLAWAAAPVGAQEENQTPPDAEGEAQTSGSEEADQDEDDELFDDELFDDGLDAILEDDTEELLEEDEPGVESSERNVFRGTKGFIELRPKLYLRDRDDGKNNEQILLKGEFEMDLRLHEDVSGFFRPRYLVDALDGDYDRFEPLEAYVTYEGDDWDLRAGQFIENWGIVDTYNPIDILNRRDLAGDVLDLERLGELGVSFHHYWQGGETIGEPTLEVYALPIWQETLFAPDDQRLSFGVEGAEFDEDRGFEPQGLQRGFYAARYKSTLNAASFSADLQGLVARGPERLPTILVDPNGFFVPAYYGTLTVGGGFRAVPKADVAGHFLSKLTFKAEVAYKNPYDLEDSPIDQPQEYVAYVVGVDRGFDHVLTDKDELTATVEYAREDGADDAPSRLRPFQNDFVLRFLWEAHDFARTSLEARGIYDFEHGEKILELIFERQLRSIDEDLKLITQLQVFDESGPGESLFGFFPNNSAIAVGVRWDF